MRGSAIRSVVALRENSEAPGADLGRHLYAVNKAGEVKGKLVPKEGCAQKLGDFEDHKKIGPARECHSMHAFSFLTLSSKQIFFLGL